MPTNTDSLKQTWTVLLPNAPVPPDRQFLFWAVTNDPSDVEQAFGITAIKFRKLNGTMSEEYIIRFASSVMNRLRRERMAQPAKVGA